MNKILIALAFLLIPSFVFCETVEWERWQDLEEYLSLFEIEVEAWYNPETQVLNFEDDFSKDIEDTLFQFGYLMEAFEFMMIDLGLEFENLELDTIIYSYFEYKDKDVSKYSYPNKQYDILMERGWLEKYFNSRPREKQDLLYSLAEDQLNELFNQKNTFK